MIVDDGDTMISYYTVDYDMYEPMRMARLKPNAADARIVPHFSDQGSAEFFHLSTPV